jgi:DNA-binding transcriptional LysR family regulator
MMKLEGLAAFVAVAEAGSISEAARRLRLSKSVISERLAELERALGITLVRRTTRRLNLTEDGAALLERAIGILRNVQDTTSDMVQRRGTLEGPLRISAPVTFGRMHLGPAIYGFLAQHPRLELSLVLDDRRVDAAADGYDAVVRHGTIDDTRLTVWQLAPSRRLLVASPAYLERCGTPRSLDDLASHRAIYYTNRGVADWRFAEDGNPIARVVRAPAVLHTNNGDVMRDAVTEGLGIALLPTFITGHAIRSGALRVVDVGVRAWGEEFIYMAHPDGRHPSARLRSLVDHLRLTFSGPASWDQDIV